MTQGKDAGLAMEVWDGGHPGRPCSQTQCQSYDGILCSQKILRIILNLIHTKKILMGLTFLQKKISKI